MTAPALAENVTGKGRHYRSAITDELYPSITNVIGVLDKPALKFWAAKLVAEQAVEDLDFIARKVKKGEQVAAIKYLKSAPFDSSERAADRGDQVHNYLEARALGSTMEEAAEEHLTTDVSRKYQKAAEEFLTGFVDDFVIVEKTVFSETHGYAGTSDFFVKLKGSGAVVIGDYKTSKKIYPEVGLQLAAGRFADRVEQNDGQYHPVPETVGAIGVRIGPRSFGVHPVDASMETFQGFLGALQAWRWKNDVAPDAVGKVLRPRITTEE